MSTSAETPNSAQTLQAIIGDVLSSAQLQALLNASGGDVGAAANAFFDGAVPSETLAKPIVPVQAPPSQEHRSVTRPVQRADANGWPKSLGTLDCELYSLVRLPAGEWSLQAGERLEIEPPRSASGPDGARKASGKRKLGAEEAMPLRFHREGDTEGASPTAGQAIGRLPASIARFVQPLLADGKVEVDAAVVGAPAKLELMTSVLIRLHVRVFRAAFDAPAALVEDSSLDRRLAFARLLDAMKLPLCDPPIGLPSDAPEQLGADPSRPAVSLLARDTAEAAVSSVIDLESSVEEKTVVVTEEEGGAARGSAGDVLPSGAGEAACCEVAVNTAVSMPMEADAEKAHGSGSVATEYELMDVEDRVDGQDAVVGEGTADEEAKSCAEGVVEISTVEPGDTDGCLTPTQEESAAAVRNAEGGAQQSGSTDGDLKLTAQQRGRMEKNRQLALQRRKVTGIDEGGEGELKDDSGRGGCDGASKLSEEQLALVEEKRMLAQRRRWEREIERWSTLIDQQPPHPPMCRASSTMPPKLERVPFLTPPHVTYFMAGSGAPLRLALAPSSPGSTWLLALLCHLGVWLNILPRRAGWWGRAVLATAVQPEVGWARRLAAHRGCRSFGRRSPLVMLTTVVVARVMAQTRAVAAAKVPLMGALLRRSLEAAAQQTFPNRSLIRCTSSSVQTALRSQCASRHQLSRRSCVDTRSRRGAGVGGVR